MSREIPRPTDPPAPVPAPPEPAVPGKPPTAPGSQHLRDRPLALLRALGGAMKRLGFEPGTRTGEA